VLHSETAAITAPGHDEDFVVPALPSGIDESIGVAASGALYPL